MNQKSLMIFLVVIIVILVGTTLYFAISGSAAQKQVVALTQQNSEKKSQLETMKTSMDDLLKAREDTKRIFLESGILGGDDIDAFKAEVSSAVPRLLLACDIAPLTNDSLPETSNVASGRVVIGGDIKNCGPTGDGRFSVTTISHKKNVNDACGVATITENGVTYALGCKKL